jgi:hypothetical protein
MGVSFGKYNKEIGSLLKEVTGFIKEAVILKYSIHKLQNREYIVVFGKLIIHSPTKPT